MKRKKVRRASITNQSLSLIEEQPQECSSIFNSRNMPILQEIVPLKELSHRKFFPQTLNRAINYLIYGTDVSKFNKNLKKQHNVFFYILETNQDTLQ